MQQSRSFNRRSLVTITAPTGRAVSVVDMKAYLRQDNTEDNAMIDAFIFAATEAVKQYTRTGLLTEVLELRIDGFSASGDDNLVGLGPGVHDGHYGSIVGNPGTVDLPFAPLQSVDSITTYDRANTSSVFSSSAYSVDTAGGRVYLNNGYTWPTELRDRDAIHIRYTAGYGEASIPEPIVQAIQQHVEAMYECRGGCSMPDECKGMLGPYKRYDQLGWF
jgi:hypothetical protein